MPRYKAWVSFEAPDAAVANKRLIEERRGWAASRLFEMPDEEFQELWYGIQLLLKPRDHKGVEITVFRDESPPPPLPALKAKNLSEIRSRAAQKRWQLEKHIDKLRRPTPGGYGKRSQS